MRDEERGTKETASVVTTEVVSDDDTSRALSICPRSAPGAVRYSDTVPRPPGER
jgi:hypothetical protein